MTRLANVPDSATALQEASTSARSDLAAGPAKAGYLIGPIFDWVFIANLYWPLLFLVASLGGEKIHTELLFWQVYFLTAPHRWITLLLVGLDRTKTQGREWKFLLLGGLIVGSCLTLNVSTGTLICLGAIDYFWNAWHFASQHHGISRIYDRRQSKAGRPNKSSLTLEKLLFRGFLLYVIARVVGVGWSSSGSAWATLFAIGDFAMILIPMGIIAKRLFRGDRSETEKPGRTYVLSVMALFLAMLFAAHLERRQLVAQLALVSAVFHSVEYMALVTWASTSPGSRSRQDLVGAMARRWVLFLAFFILFMGFTNYVIARGYQQTWILINLIVAFLHYGYDGMIWKSRPSQS